MKNLGALGAVLIFIAGLFKYMHWPFANQMLLLGMVICVLFLFAWVGPARKHARSGKQRVAVIAVFITALLTALAATFKIMHWPGGQMLVWTSLGFLLFFFIPLYLNYVFNEDDDDRKNNATGFFVVYLVMSAITLTIGNSLHWVNAIKQQSKGEDAFSSVVKENNDKLLAQLSSDTTKASSAETIKTSSTDMLNYLADLRKELITRASDGKTEADHLEEQEGYNPGDYDTPTMVLIGDATMPKNTKFSAVELRSKLSNYSEKLNASLGATDFNTGIDLSDISTHHGMKEPWEIAVFYHAPMATVISYLDNLRAHVLTAEGMALSRLISK